MCPGAACHWVQAAPFSSKLGSGRRGAEASVSSLIRKDKQKLTLAIGSRAGVASSLPSCQNIPLGLPHPYTEGRDGGWCYAASLQQELALVTA